MNPDFIDYPLFKVPILPNVHNVFNEIKYNHVLDCYLMQFNSILQKILEVNNILAISDYDHAIHILILTLDLKKGDSIIISPYCCRALIHPFLIHEVEIIWSDIDPKTGTLDPSSVEKRIQPSTSPI